MKAKTVRYTPEPLPTLTKADRAKLKALAALHNQNAPLAGATLLGAMGLIGLSAATWRAPIPGQGKAFQS